eukprot:Sdes_comp20084_c0_seq1m13017
MKKILPYEEEIFQSLLQQDALLIMAPGLGIERILLKLIKLYCDPRILVLAINFSHVTENYVLDQLENVSCWIPHPENSREPGTPLLPSIKLPCSITSAFSSQERAQRYLQGGVVFITTRILVIDILTERIPTHLIAGVLVENAHQIGPDSMEAFILKLYRERNQTGFIKAFSENAQQISSGFANLEKIMRNLYVKNLFIWPRFQEAVKNCLAAQNSANFDCFEEEIFLSDSMKLIQQIIYELISNCLLDLKKNHPSIADFSPENSPHFFQDPSQPFLHPFIDQIITLQFQPIWHQLNQRSKQILADVKFLKSLLENLFTEDAVTFFNSLQTFLAANSFKINAPNWNFSPSAWIFSDLGARLFNVAKSRVFQAKTTPSTSIKSPRFQNHDPETPHEISLVLETNPKWSVLENCIKEIFTNAAKNQAESRILILAETEKTCRQIKNLLQNGPKNHLKSRFLKSQNWNSEIQNTLHHLNSTADVNQPAETPLNYPQKSFAIKRKRPERTSQKSASFTPFSSTNHSFAQKQKFSKQFLSAIQKEISASPPKKSRIHQMKQPQNFHLLTPLKPENSRPILTIWPFQNIAFSPFSASANASNFLLDFLEAFQPSHIVLYQPNLKTIRNIELFHALNPHKTLAVYTLTYSKSWEEHAYLFQIQKEKAAFVNLIHQKSNMAVLKNQDGRCKPETATADPTAASSRNARKSSLPKIIVDLREFRASLPPLLYAAGFHLTPITLEIADYILASSIAVERKSIADFIASLHSGRLYAQMEAMVKFYKHPCLLLEFHDASVFSLLPSAAASTLPPAFSGVTATAASSQLAEISIHHVPSKLVLLTLCFPSMRIFWSENNICTAEIFRRVKSTSRSPTRTRSCNMGWMRRF